jgi:hypothetical protein
MKSNASEVFRVLIERIEGVKDDVVARTCAVAVLPEMKQRIHVEGKDASGAQIGTYSNEYMKLRTGNYQNSGKFSKGKNKGNNKNAGVFTDRTIRLDKNTGVFSGEDKVGKARPQYHRSADTKVILSLTRQMENDWSLVEGADAYGLGFKNPLNYSKSIWCETTYNKPIYQLTQQEKEIVSNVAKGFADQITGKQ